MKKIVLAALVVAFVAGCSTNPTTAPVEDKSSGTDPSAASTAGVRGVAGCSRANS